MRSNSCSSVHSWMALGGNQRLEKVTTRWPPGLQNPGHLVKYRQRVDQVLHHTVQKTTSKVLSGNGSSGSHSSPEPSIRSAGGCLTSSILIETQPHHALQAVPPGDVGLPAAHEIEHLHAIPQKSDRCFSPWTRPCVQMLDKPRIAVKKRILRKNLRVKSIAGQII